MKRIAFLSFFILTSCFSQERRVEKLYSKCYFNSFQDKGKQLKKYLKEYETLLISEKILKDDSGKSYYDLFKKILKDDFYDDKTNYSLIDTVNKLSYAKLVHYNQKCTEKIKTLDIYKKSRTYLLEKRADSIKSDFSVEKMNAVFLKTFNEKDFEIDFYKLRILLLLDFHPIEKEKNAQYPKEIIDNAFKIKIEENNKVFVRSKLIKRHNLERYIKSYLLENKAKSLVIVTTNRDVIYGDYIKLIEDINAIIFRFKNEISKKKFNKKYDELLKGQQEIIQKEFSFDIYENLNNL